MARISSAGRVTSSGRVAASSRATPSTRDPDILKPSSAVLYASLSSQTGFTTANTGTLGSTLQLGDGVTGSTKPAQISPNGVTLTGTEYMTYPDDGSLDFANGVNFSIEFAVGQVVDGGTILCVMQKVKDDGGLVGASGNHGFDVLLRNDTAGNPLQFRCRDTNNTSANLSGSVDMTTSGVKHVVINMKWATAEIYINGILNASGSFAGLAGTLSTNGTLYIATAGASGFYFVTANLYRPIIRRVALTAPEVSLAYYNFFKDDF